jgi:hypothetical protein
MLVHSTPSITKGWGEKFDNADAGYPLPLLMSIYASAVIIAQSMRQHNPGFSLFELNIFSLKPNGVPT